MSSGFKPDPGEKQPAPRAPVRAVSDPRFQRAFVAMRYLLGARGAELANGLPAPLASDAQRLCEALKQPVQAERARILAKELKLVALSLDTGEFR